MNADVRRLAALGAVVGPPVKVPDPPAPAPDCTEAAFQRAVVSLADSRGWLVYHTHDSRRSNPGFPDLVLCRPPRAILAELKTSKGRLRPEQVVWRDLLRLVPGLEYRLWRPAMWGEILEALSWPG